MEVLPWHEAPAANQSGLGLRLLRPVRSGFESPAVVPAWLEAPGSVEAGNACGTSGRESYVMA